MDLVVPDPEALGGPTGTWPRVCSNLSNIKYHQPKPNHCSDGKESTYIFSAGVHKQRPCMPMTTCTTGGKDVHRTVPNYPLMRGKKWYILCTLFRRGVQWPEVGQNPQNPAEKT